MEKKTKKNLAIGIGIFALGLGMFSIGIVFEMAIVGLIGVTLIFDGGVRTVEFTAKAVYQMVSNHIDMNARERAFLKINKAKIEEYEANLSSEIQQEKQSKIQKSNKSSKEIKKSFDIDDFEKE